MNESQLFLLGMFAAVSTGAIVNIAFSVKEIATHLWAIKHLLDKPKEGGQS